MTARKFVSDSGSAPPLVVQFGRGQHAQEAVESSLHHPCFVLCGSGVRIEMPTGRITPPIQRAVSKPDLIHRRPTTLAQRLEACSEECSIAEPVRVARGERGALSDDAQPLPDAAGAPCREQTARACANRDRLLDAFEPECVAIDLRGASLERRDRGSGVSRKRAGRGGGRAVGCGCTGRRRLARGAGRDQECENERAAAAHVPRPRGHFRSGRAGEAPRARVAETADAEAEEHEADHEHRRLNAHGEWARRDISAGDESEERKEAHG